MKRARLREPHEPRDLRHTAQWTLAQAWSHADASQQFAIATMLDALNAYLGNAIGEFVGELTLYGSFAAFALAMWRTGARRMAVFGAVTAVAGWLSMFRNIASVVQPAAGLGNILLPQFLISFGVMLVRLRRSSASSVADVASRTRSE